MYFSVFGKDEACELQRQDPYRALVVPGAENAHLIFLSCINGRLLRDFGINPYWTTHVSWRNSEPDEINYLFNGMEPVRYSNKGNADLLVGFWPPNLANYTLDTFLPRKGGDTYRKAWDEIIALPLCKMPWLVFAESWNEYTEGSGIYPARPIVHTLLDMHWSGAVELEECLNDHAIAFRKTIFGLPIHRTRWRRSFILG